jgi:hypothetical protein
MTVPLYLCAFAPLREIISRKGKEKRSLCILRYSRAFFVPTPRTPSMGALAHVERIFRGSRQPPHHFALFIAQFVPGSQTPNATARTLIVSPHLSLFRYS